MGAQIAAHFANAGVPVLLLDLTADIARDGLKRARALKPDPLFTPDTASLITITGVDAATVNDVSTFPLVSGTTDLSAPNSVLIDTTMATTDFEGQSEILCYQFGVLGIANDLWFAWVAPFSGTARVSSCGATAGDTKFAAYAGTVSLASRAARTTVAVGSFHR